MGAVIHLGVGRGSACCPGYRLRHRGWGSNEVPTADGCTQGPREAAILTRALQRIGRGFSTPLVVSSVTIVDNLSLSSLLLRFSASAILVFVLFSLTSGVTWNQLRNLSEPPFFSSVKWRCTVSLHGAVVRITWSCHLEHACEVGVQQLLASTVTIALLTWRG